jgi:hypothetical protein
MSSLLEQSSECVDLGGISSETKDRPPIICKYCPVMMSRVKIVDVLNILEHDVATHCGK